MATAGFKTESPFNGISEREHHESDFKWVSIERNRKRDNFRFQVQTVHGLHQPRGQHIWSGNKNFLFSFYWICYIMLQSASWFLKIIRISFAFSQIIGSEMWEMQIIRWLGHACSVWSGPRGEHPFGKHLGQVRTSTLLYIALPLLYLYLMYLMYLYLYPATPHLNSGTLLYTWSTHALPMYPESKTENILIASTKISLGVFHFATFNMIH